MIAQPREPAQPEKRGRPLRVAASVLLGLGLPAAAAGGALVGIDSRPACGAADPRECEFLHDTLPGGAALLAAGGAAVLTSVVLFVLDSRRSGKPPSPSAHLFFIGSGRPRAASGP